MGGGDCGADAAEATPDTEEEVGGSYGGNEVTVNIRCSSGSEFSVQITLDSTVESFKSILAQKCDVPADQQRLIYKGRILKNDRTLQSYGIEGDHTVHLVRGFAQEAANSGGPRPTGGSNASQNVTRPVGSDDSGQLGGSSFGASLFPGLDIGSLGGSGGLFGAGLPDIDQMQQQLTTNPNVIWDIMNMPMFRNLLNNPEVIRNMIMSNPQMRDIIDRNPELAHVLNDPSTLCQTLEAARNPELMREMMRNTDRAMSNIESSPEGFNMLRRMYENVQEPLLNATTMAGNSGNDRSNTFSAVSGAQGRDGSNNQFTTASVTTASSRGPNSNPLPNPWIPAGTGGAQINTTRSNRVADTRAQAPTGLGGLSLPDFGSMFGTMQDTNPLNQLMQNPAITQMMQSLLSNPEYMNQILGLNPHLRDTLDSNAQLREMLQNSDLLHQLTSPETLEGGQGGRDTGTPNHMGLERLMNMFGGLMAGSPGVPNRSNVPPEELYAAQLT